MHVQDLKDFGKKLEEIALLDVRVSEQFATGHLKGAVNIALEDLPENLERLDKNETYYIVCRSGNRSNQATNYLKELGYQAVNLEGGMNAWTGEIVKD